MKMFNRCYDFTVNDQRYSESSSEFVVTYHAAHHEIWEQDKH